MKMLLSYVATASMVVGLISLTNCGKDADPTPVERTTQMLISNGGKWSPSPTGGVMVQGIDVTADLFPAFTITFSRDGFTTTGTSPVWLRQDTWQFKDETATVILRGQDNKEITIEEISNTQLKLTLEWTETTYSGGRRHSLAGKHEFFLTK